MACIMLCYFIFVCACVHVSVYQRFFVIPHIDPNDRLEVFKTALTWLTAREDFVAFICVEIFDLTKLKMLLVALKVSVSGVLQWLVIDYKFLYCLEIVNLLCTHLYVFILVFHEHELNVCMCEC